MATVLAWRAFSGTRKDGTKVYGIIPQFDGSTFADTNCGAASEAMRVSSQQKGVRPSKGNPWFPTGRSIRLETGDEKGGLMPSQTTAASSREYGVSAASPRISTWTSVISRSWAGYAVDLCISYGPIAAAGKSGSPGFVGSHRVVIVGIRNWGTGLQLLVADPLYDGRRAGIPMGPQWIASSVMKRAAGNLLIDGRSTLTASRGEGMAYYVPSLTRVAPSSTGWRFSVSAQTFWAYRVVDGKIQSRVAKTTGGFSGSCTEPDVYPWAGRGDYTLVKVTSGAYSGIYIARKFAKEV
jgi:hypothetical protein